MTAGSTGIGGPGKSRPTRRGVLVGASLAGLGGALAGGSTAAGRPAGGGRGGGGGKPKKSSASPKASGTVLGTASEIPVGGGKIFTAARVVVTQPVRGQYNGFSAVCTHVGCILSEVADGTIDCPCHGSEFKISNGAVVTG